MPDAVSPPPDPAASTALAVGPRLANDAGPGRWRWQHPCTDATCSAPLSATDLPSAATGAARLKELGKALACFQAALTGLGLAKSVTTFTRSDFGRTFKPNNNSGTDHAWGNHHLVMGGAVRGGFHGSYPTLAVGGPDDVAVNTSSVTQYAATLLGWMGASAGQLDTLLPNLANFGSARTLGFV